jgi:hypothetical protein
LVVLVLLIVAIDLAGDRGDAGADEVDGDGDGDSGIVDDGSY